MYPSDKWTEQELQKLEKRLADVYKQAEKELNGKARNYFKQFSRRYVKEYAAYQAGKYTKLADLFKDIQADPATIEQAQKDIADDGYWGVEQTSDRLVSMAQALSGGDTSKADTLIAAIKKGFDEATEAWGDKLPDICQKTIDAAVKKMEAWRDGTTSETDA